MPNPKRNEIKNIYINIYIYIFIRKTNVVGSKINKNNNSNKNDDE